MSILEKSIKLLNDLPEHEVETIYDFILFIHSRNILKQNRTEGEEIDDILNRLTGSIQDSGKTLDEYKHERIMERYEAAD